MKYKNGKPVKIKDWVEIRCKLSGHSQRFIGQYIGQEKDNLYVGDCYNIKIVIPLPKEFSNIFRFYPKHKEFTDIQIRKLSKSEIVMVRLQN